MPGRWSETSLRTWIAIGMALAVVPLAASAVTQHELLERGVLMAFRSVARRQRDEIDPIQKLRLALWEASVPIDGYLDTHEPRQAEIFRQHRIRIEATFALLHARLDGDRGLRELLQRAQDDWSTADRLADQIVSKQWPPGDPTGAALADRFDRRVASSSDKLKAVYTDLDGDVARQHAAATFDYERSRWIVGIAASVSLFLMFAGVAVIGRVMVTNVDRLVEGAKKFAQGSREHRIDVQVPPELRRIANEFNHMIERIHESEAALAEQARADPMTGLPNRRAFDEAIETAFARMRRLGEEVLLFMLDVDHFKSVNDTYGHAAGDDVLRAVAETMQSNIREVDQAFRIGGEEFVVLLTGTDLAGAKIAAERLRTAIAARPLMTDSGQVRVTASIGIARAGNGLSRSELLRAADSALYRAKSAGRDCIVIAGVDSDA